MSLDLSEFHSARRWSARRARDGIGEHVGQGHREVMPHSLDNAQVRPRDVAGDILTALDTDERIFPAEVFAEPANSGIPFGEGAPRYALER
jgi:hypothetical protein